MARTKKTPSPLEVEYRRLTAFMGTDAFRPSIFGVVHVDADGWAVSTEGTRLYATRRGPAMEAGDYERDRTEVRAGFAPIPGRTATFPDWRSLMPTAAPTWSATFAVPAWLTKAERASESITCALMPEGLFIIGAVPSGDPLVTFDLRLFGPFAGQTVRITGQHPDYYSSQLADFPPIIVSEPSDGPRGDLFSLEWFGLIMPLNPKMLKSPISGMVIAFPEENDQAA